MDDWKFLFNFREIEHIISVSNDNTIRTIYMTFYSYAKAFQKNKKGFFCTYPNIKKLSGITDNNVIKKAINELIGMYLLEKVSTGYNQATVYRCKNLLTTSKDEITYEVKIKKDKKDKLKLILSHFNENFNIIINIPEEVEKNKDKIRTLRKNGETWFFANDVCEMLKLSNANNSLKSLPDNQKGVGIINNDEGMQSIGIVNLEGFLKLMKRSKKITKQEKNKILKWISNKENKLN